MSLLLVLKSQAPFYFYFCRPLIIISCFSDRTHPLTILTRKEVTFMAHQADQKCAQYTNQDDRCSTQVYYIPLPNMGTQSLNQCNQIICHPTMTLSHIATTTKCARVLLIDTKFFTHESVDTNTTFVTEFYPKSKNPSGLVLM